MIGKKSVHLWTNKEKKVYQSWVVVVVFVVVLVQKKRKINNKIFPRVRSYTTSLRQPKHGPDWSTLT